MLGFNSQPDALEVCMENRVIMEQPTCPVYSVSSLLIRYIKKNLQEYKIGTHVTYWGFSSQTQNQIATVVFLLYFPFCLIIWLELRKASVSSCLLQYVAARTLPFSIWDLLETCFITLLISQYVARPMCGYYFKSWGNPVCKRCVYHVILIVWNNK